MAEFFPKDVVTYPSSAQIVFKSSTANSTSAQWHVLQQSNSALDLFLSASPYIVNLRSLTGGGLKSDYNITASRMYVSNSTPIATNELTSKSYVDSVSAAAVSGSAIGTAGTIAKFNSTTSLVNSIITESGTLITVAGSLSAGSITSNGNIMAFGKYIYGDTTTPFVRLDNSAGTYLAYGATNYWYHGGSIAGLVMSNSYIFSSTGNTLKIIRDTSISVDNLEPLDTLHLQKNGDLGIVFSRDNTNTKTGYLQHYFTGVGSAKAFRLQQMNQSAVISNVITTDENLNVTVTSSLSAIETISANTIAALNNSRIVYNSNNFTTGFINISELEFKNNDPDVYAEHIISFFNLLPGDKFLNVSWMQKHEFILPTDILSQSASITGFIYSASSDSMVLLKQFVYPIGTTAYINASTAINIANIVSTNDLTNRLCFKTRIIGGLDTGTDPITGSFKRMILEIKSV